MSPAPTDSHGRAPRRTARMARSLFLMVWTLTLLPILILFAAGYVLFGAQWQNFPGGQGTTGTFAATVGGLILLMGLLSYGLALRVTTPLQNLIASLSTFAQGSWNERVAVTRQDEIGQLAHLFNTLADEMKEIYTLLAARSGEDQDGENRATLTQLARIIETAPDVGELQRTALELIVKCYACSFAALYRIERVWPPGSWSPASAVLACTYGRLDGLPAELGQRIRDGRISLEQSASSAEAPGPEWIGSKALTTRRAQVGQVSPASSAGADPGDGPTSPVRPASPTINEAALPLISRGPDGSQHLVGMLDLYAGSRMTDSRLGPFANRPLSEMQAIANLLALALDCMSPGIHGSASSAPSPGSAAILSPTGLPPGLLPLAGATLANFFSASRQIAQANEVVEVLEAVGGALRQSPFVTALLILSWAEGDNRPLLGPPAPPGSPAPPDLPELEVIDCRREPVSMRGEGQPDLELEPLQSFFLALQGTPVIVDDIGKRLNEARTGSSAATATVPQALLEVAQRIGAESAAFLPVIRNARLSGLLIVGRPPKPVLRNLQSPPLNSALLEPYANLAYLAAAALERIRFQGGTQRRLAELETLWQVSQTLAAETQLQAVFPILHQQLETVMGTLNSFATIIYDHETNQVHIPYLYEDGSLLTIPSFPLANTLTSQVISSRQPLLLRTLDEVEAASQRLGMVQVGETPLSWLGAPMLFGGEVLGAIVVQDIWQEGRFDENDQRLLTTLATQAAVVVRNARLLEATQQQVEQEQRLREIGDRIRGCVDIESILKTTADELGRAVGARRAKIQITPGNPDPHGIVEADLRVRPAPSSAASAGSDSGAEKVLG